MKVYEFGAENAPAVLQLPGTCCHWKGNFGHVIPLLEDDCRVLCGGHIRAAYGCSLGGSFVGLLAARWNIRMDYGILGGSDLDQSSKLAAKLQTELQESVLFRPYHAAAGEDRRSRDGDTYFLCPQNGRKIP